MRALPSCIGKHLVCRDSFLQYHSQVPPQPTGSGGNLVNGTCATVLPLKLTKSQNPSLTSVYDEANTIKMPTEYGMVENLKQFSLNPITLELHLLCRLVEKHCAIVLGMFGTHLSVILYLNCM